MPALSRRPRRAALAAALAAAVVLLAAGLWPAGPASASPAAPGSPASAGPASTGSPGRRGTGAAFGRLDPRRFAGLLVVHWRPRRIGQARGLVPGGLLEQRRE
jgi:hypothetical protein